MDLIDNPIGGMRGPEFLALYVLAASAVSIIASLRVRRSDRTGELPVASIPGNPDPYETAFLRGGQEEVRQLAILSLIQEGFLEVVKKPPDWPHAYVW